MTLRGVGYETDGFWTFLHDGFTGYPRVQEDVGEKETKIYLIAPKIDTSGIKVEIQGARFPQLVISYHSEKKQGEPLIYNGFEYPYVIRENWDVDNIIGEYEDGVLTITIPHRKETVKKIPIYGKDKQLIE